MAPESNAPPPGAHRSLAWSLAGVVAALIVYASLYPFSDWRFQGVAPWDYLFAPWPQYWTAFDVGANLVGYMPLGLLLAVAVVRSGGGGWSWPVGVLAPAVLSLCLEAVQNLLPARVPSQLDWLLNSLGGAIGTALGHALLRWRVLGPWNQFRAQWLVAHPHGGALMLLLWPWAVLYPAPVPFGLGHFWPRAEALLWRVFDDTPFAAWLPNPVAQAHLSPLGEAVAVGLSLWAPALLGYALLRQRRQRLVFGLVGALLVLGLGALSATLTYGPAHAWAWLTPPVALGLGLALGLSLASMALSHRAAALLMLMALTFALGLLNRASEAAYFAQSLALWEQGRFIRFHGLSQWLGWLWPLGALWVGLQLALRRGGGHYNPPT